MAEQVDPVMFFAMNEFGPVSAGRCFLPPISARAGPKQQ
jgi:hypothetical protein